MRTARWTLTPPFSFLDSYISLVQPWDFPKHISSSLSLFTGFCSVGVMPGTATDTGLKHLNQAGRTNVTRNVGVRARATAPTSWAGHLSQQAS